MQIIIDILKLMFGTSVGSIATIYNLQMSKFAETISNLLGYAAALTAVVSGILTIIFLYWQIKKIRKEIKKIG